MERRKSAEIPSNENVRYRYNELISKSGGELVTTPRKLRMEQIQLEDHLLAEGVYSKISPRSSMKVSSSHEKWFKKLLRRHGK